MKEAESLREFISVRANIRLLPTTESGRKSPICGSYRPNHNFFGPESRLMTIGHIDLPEGVELHPGESMELTVRFVNWPGLGREFYPGREWRIQQGLRLIAFGTMIEVLPDVDDPSTANGRADDTTD